MNSALILKEIRDSVSNRWLQAYIVVLVILGLVVLSFGMQQVINQGLQMYGRTTATLINLCLLITPLFSISLGASAITGEKDQGTLDQLLVQPISRTELLISKYVGLWLAMFFATLLGFFPSVIFLMLFAGISHLPYVILFPFISQLLITVMLSLGFFISVLSKSRAQAQMMSILLWFGFVLIYDFLLIGGLSVIPSPSISFLVGCLLANPVDAIRVLSLLILEPDLYQLGPAGSYLMQTLTIKGAIIMIGLSLLFWAIIPLSGAIYLLKLKPSKKTKRMSIMSTSLGLLLLISCGEKKADPEINPLLQKPNYDVTINAETIEKGNSVYQKYCAPCHGATGHGDGPGAASMNPKPRRHTDKVYMDKLSNEHLYKVIKQGGGFAGFPAMPANPSLKDEEIKAIIAFMRNLPAE